MTALAATHALRASAKRGPRAPSPSLNLSPDTGRVGPRGGNGAGGLAEGVSKRGCPTEDAGEDQSTNPRDEGQWVWDPRKSRPGTKSWECPGIEKRSSTW